MASKASSSGLSSPSSSGFDEDSFASSESDPPSQSESSTDSESRTAPSVRRVRGSRRRWRSSAGKATALLPPAEPASTSLWTTREKQFEKFRSSQLSMAVPEGVGRVDKARGYSLHVMSVLNWVLPDSVLHTSAIPASAGSEDDQEEPLITLGVHVSLFHAASKRFFGNTWVSPELAVDPFHIKQARHPKDGTLRYVIENALLNFRAYFVSDIVDATCVGVLELVAYEKDPDSKATVRVVGCGWTLLPLFARQQAVQSGTKDEPSAVPSAFSLNASGDSVGVFTGSPRVLWELNPDAWSAQEKHEGSKFYYQLVQYEPMLAIAMFLRKNELVGALDLIPGLKNANLANIDMGKNPKMLLREEGDASYEESLASFVKIASLVPKSVQVEDPFELSVTATRVAINLRDEIEANLIARLRISRKAIHEGASSVEGEVSARVLKIALHNGRCFRTRQFTVPLKADPNGGDTLLCVRNHNKLRGFVFHPHMAIVVVLQYTVHFRVIWPSKLKQQALEAKKPPLPEEDVVLVTMGARALVPSDGKKLYLYDKHHHATAVSAEPLTTLGGVLLQEQEEHRRVLHVDLLSGAPCRPYSDNTLYTPPDQAARSLQSREVSVKDSFAFCDLKITVDEALSVEEPNEQTQAPASPVKAADESNQTALDDDDCAADQWARKLLGKANSNPVLAQTLNALASSPTPRTPSPIKKQQASRPADPTARVPDAPTAELSRASKTLLSRYGYMEPHDKPPSSPTNNQKDHEQRKASNKVGRIAKSIEAEVSDPFRANEIRFHFAAYRACSAGSDGKAAPSRVYFTFQFYSYPPTRTETLRLSKAFDNGAGGEIQTYLLMQDTPANKPSLAIQFDVDTTSTMNPLETRRFAEYLKWNSLYVDVWDADSLFQLGTFAIPLHELLRQGKNVKKFQAEVEISPPLGETLTSDACGDEESGAVCTVPSTRGGGEHSSIGRVQLLMSSYGLKGENYIDQQPSNQTGVTPTEASGDQPIRKPKHRVRARPLVESNPELYRLLSQEGFYGDRSLKELRERKTAQPRRRQGVGETNTLTPKEIAILCDLFGSRKAASDAARSSESRSTRIQCDLEGRTGLLALLSLRPPEVARTADSAAKPVEDQPAEVAKPPEKTQTVDVAAPDHAQRLKRVLAIATKNQLALADAFALFDANHDGFLSRDEFVKALRSLGSAFDDLSDEDVGLLADLLDTNKDGKIEYREFRQFVQQPTQMSSAQWRDHIKRIVLRAMEKGIRVHHVFAEMDTSGDGKLSYDEFERGLSQLGISTDSDKKGVRDLLAELDQDLDGTISYTEFLESLGISVEENKREVVQETVKDITEDVRKILSRLTKKGINFEDVFVHFDTDRNGTLSVEEFTQALNQLMQLDKSQDSSADTLKTFERDAVEVYVKSINADGDTKIDYREFLTACGVSGKEMQQEAAHFQQAARDQAERRLIKLMIRACASGMSIHEVFEQFDSNSDGGISIAEFQGSMEQLFLGQGMTADDAALVAARFDTNRDGMISRREFQDFGTDLQKKQHELVALFTPHLDKLSGLDRSTKLAATTWTAFCKGELGLSPREVSAEVMTLTTYFGFVDGDGSVDVEELCALCKTVQSTKTPPQGSGKETAVARLRTLLAKAKDQGVDLKKSFAHFDANGDGEISCAELKRGLVALGCFDDMKDEDVDALVDELDEDGSGKIDFTEFRALVTGGGVATDANVDDKEELMSKLKALMEKAVEKGVSVDACFAHFDKDGDGNIKREEFVMAMTELGFDADKSVVDGVMKLLDRNQSGAISLSEFKQLFPAPSVPSSEAPSPEAASEKQKTPRVEGTTDSKPASASQTTEEKLRKLLLSAEASGVDVNKCFAHFDSDNSGMITQSEFVTAIKQLPGFEDVADDETAAIVRKLDKDGSASVSLQEFEAFLRQPAPPSTPDTDTTMKEQHVQDDDATPFTEVADESSPPSQESEAPADTAVKATDAVATEDVKDDALLPVEPPSSYVEAGQDNTVGISTDPFQASEGGDESVPVEQPVVKEAEAAKPKTADSLTEETPAPPSNTSQPDRAPRSPKNPSEQGAAQVSDGGGSSDPPRTTETTQAAPKDAQGKARPSTRPVRSSSFGKGKNPETVAAAGAPFRRTNTDPKAEGAGDSETSGKLKAPPQRVSFAAARTAMRASKTPGSRDGEVPLSNDASEGLSRLKKLLQTAAERGVAVQQSFNHFDKEATGLLSYADFVAGLRQLGPDFANLSDDDMTAMAKALDGSQQNGLRVDDFVSFLNASTVAEKPADAPEGDDQPAAPTSGPKEAPATSSKRPPPLRRAGSSRIPTKKPPRPSSGPQSARAVTETGAASASTQDKPWKTKPAGQPKPAEAAITEPMPSTEPAAKAPDGVADVPAQPATPRVQTEPEGGVASLDCNYTFNSNPEIRAVELKLRQTALDAYQRGVLPLRVVSKFLEDADDRRGRVPGSSGREHARKKRSELLRVEFLQVLMELGFTLLSDRDDDDDGGQAGGGRPRPVTKMNDHLYARQLERLARYRQHTKSDEAKAHRQLVRAVAKTTQRSNQDAADSLRRFEDEKSQLLRVLSYYRDGHKKALVYSLLRQQVTTSLSLFPSFGDLLFFELPFANPYTHSDRFRIELLLPSAREVAVVLDVEIVRSSDEWAFYRENLPLAYGFLASSAAVEKEMIDDHDEVVMDAHDQLHVPMRLRWLDTTDSYTARTAEQKAAIPVSVVVKSCSHGHTVALFNVELRPQPFACHRVLRFSHPAASIWRWKLKYPRGKFVVCMDPSVAMELLRDGEDEANSSGLASFKCRVGEYPALETFFVVLYDDKYYARVHEVWQLRIQAKLRVDVHAVLGQSVRHELVIKGDGGASSGEAPAASKRHVRCFTPMRHRSLVQFRPGQVFALVPRAFNRIEFSFCAVETGVGKQAVVLVNLVDVETRELVGAWSVHVTLALPAITKTYELRLPAGRAAQKKISYSNPWDQPQTILLRSSAPRLLLPREPVLQLPGNGQAFLRLAFAARTHSAATPEDIYLFINDKRTDQNEECLLFQVAYE